MYWNSKVFATDDAFVAQINTKISKWQARPVQVTFQILLFTMCYWECYIESWTYSMTDFTVACNDDVECYLEYEGYLEYWYMSASLVLAELHVKQSIETECINTCIVLD